jgi:hypothetical protein
VHQGPDPEAWRRCGHAVFPPVDRLALPAQLYLPMNYVN